MSLSIYILRLQGGKYYVGKTMNVAKRYQEHVNGQGAQWTRLYKPISVEQTIPNASPFDEDKMVKECMAKYGIENVRGGSYVQEELSEFHMDALNMEIWAAQDKCTQCGRKGHFVKDCYAKTDVEGNEISYEDDSDDSEYFCPKCNKFFQTENKYDNHPCVSNRPIDVDSVNKGAGSVVQNLPFSKSIVTKNVVETLPFSPVINRQGTVNDTPRYLHSVKKNIQSKNNFVPVNVDTINAPLKNEVRSVKKEIHKKPSTCFRCGREGHYAPDCYAGTHVKGYRLD
jgi:hypothetical protein